MRLAPCALIALAPLLAASASSPAPAASAPAIVHAPIAYGPARLRAMAEYSRRHYGDASWALAPRAIVLHYTWGPSYASARAHFEADRPNRGERPGVCAHYVVDRDGTVYELVPPTVRCRHTVGLNDVALGVEIVQPPGPSARWADRQILARPAQMRAALALVRYLQARFGIATDDVLGHGTANASHWFHDRAGWRNEHDDWLADDLAEFKRRL